MSESAQPLVPVRAMPSMNCRWNSRYSTSIGIIDSVEPAIRIGYLVVNCPCLEEIPADSVIMLMLLDPHAGAELSMDDIVAMCDELIEAHGSWLPQYT